MFSGNTREVEEGQPAIASYHTQLLGLPFEFLAKRRIVVEGVGELHRRPVSAKRPPRTFKRREQ